MNAYIFSSVLEQHRTIYLNLVGRQPQWTMVYMDKHLEDNHNIRYNSIKEDINLTQPEWKNTSLEDNFD